MQLFTSSFLLQISKICCKDNLFLDTAVIYVLLEIHYHLITEFKNSVSFFTCLDVGVLKK